MIKYLQLTFRRNIMIEFIGGVLMAFANSVPGVSGGTIAFLLGFLDDTVEHVNRLISKKTSGSKKKSLFFLSRLGLGWLIGFVAAVLIVTSVFETHIYAISSLFIGFILFSIPLVVYEERETLKGRYYNVLWMIPGFALVIGITLLSGFSDPLYFSTVFKKTVGVAPKDYLRRNRKED